MTGKLIIGLLAIFLLAIPVACAKDTEPASEPPPAEIPVSKVPESMPIVTPKPKPRPAKFVQMTADISKETYLPGEEIILEISFTNITTEAYEISPFPPLVKVREVRGSDEVIRSFPAGTTTVILRPNETEQYTLLWDQRDDHGEQMPYGYYDFYIPRGGTLEDLAVVGGVYILPAEGIIEQTIDVNELQTVGGITITLNRVELTAEGLRFFAFNADYSMSDKPLLTGVFPYAEYHLDGGPTMEGGTASDIGGGSTLDGLEYVWTMSMPVPRGTKELTFVITEFWEHKGPWEFRVTLE